MSLKGYIALSLAYCLQSAFSFAQVWSDVGGGVTRWPSPIFNIESLGLYNNEIYASGYFDTAGTTPAANLARWNGANWDSVGLGFDKGFGGIAFAFCEVNGLLYMGGHFVGLSTGLPPPNDIIPHTENLAKWDGANWTPVSTSTPDNYVYCMQNYNNEVYVGGNFVQVGTLGVSRIAKWNGANWSDVGGGVTGGFGIVSCMAIYKGELYVGGDFGGAGGISAHYIARWNGANWDSVGGGLDYYVTSMVVDSIADLNH